MNLGMIYGAVMLLIARDDPANITVVQFVDMAACIGGGEPGVEIAGVGSASVAETP